MIKVVFESGLKKSELGKVTAGGGPYGCVCCMCSPEVQGGAGYDAAVQATIAQDYKDV